jgi:hypothetical protein
LPSNNFRDFAEKGLKAILEEGFKDFQNYYPTTLLFALITILSISGLAAVAMREIG